jgi:hypothetical protein
MSNFSLHKIVKTNRFQKTSLLLIAVLLFQVVYPVLLPREAHAGVLTEASIRLDRMGAAVAANTTDAKILVVVKPTTTGTEATVKISWPTTSAFTVDATAANHTTSTASLPSTYQGESLTAWPTIGATASSVSGGDVTFSSGELTVGTLYGFYITGGITNPSAGNAGTHTVTITTEATGPSEIDSQSVAVDTVGTNADQVSVTATVPASFNFALSGNSIALGTLSTSARTTGNVTVDVDTNANNGWVAWIRSEGAAATLASAATGDSISSTDDPGNCVTAVIGSKGYVVDVNAAAGSNGSGTLSVDTEYDCTDGQAGGVIATTYEQVAQRTGVIDSDTLTLTAVVTISPTTAAASDYTDTWEVVGAGNF